MPEEGLHWAAAAPVREPPAVSLVRQVALPVQQVVRVQRAVLRVQAALRV